MKHKSVGQALRRSLPVVAAVLLFHSIACGDERQPRTMEIRVQSSMDGSSQPALFWTPGDGKQSTSPRPLLVFLHSWSGDWQQDNSAWVEQATRRDWVYLQPDFRGRNDHPEACGSGLARQDILDAVQWAIDKRDADPSRIYLAGVSGGGHMAMLMAARHPERFSAVSAWVGISNLEEWHRFHSRGEGPDRYAEMIVACCGGPPGSSKAIDEQYRDRSPVFWLQNIGDLPLDLNAGASDGKTGSVPIDQTLRAFNAVVGQSGDEAVSEIEIQQLLRDGRLAAPLKQDVVEDSTYGREIRMRRVARQTRVTIFDGGHEGLPEAACAWLERHSRLTTSKEQLAP